MATLIPYAAAVDGGDPASRRARVAREIFVLGASPGVPVNAPSLAMVALNRGVVEWIDPYLVRREAALDQGDLLGLSSRRARCGRRTSCKSPISSSASCSI